MRMSHDYFLMVKHWRDVCALPISESDKAAECAKMFQDFIGKMAESAARSQNPADRFYGLMLALHSFVLSSFRDGQLLVELAIQPAHMVVLKWLRTNNTRRF